MPRSDGHKKLYLGKIDRENVPKNWKIRPENGEIAGKKGRKILRKTCKSRYSGFQALFPILLMNPSLK